MEGGWWGKELGVVVVSFCMLARVGVVEGPERVRCWVGQWVDGGALLFVGWRVGKDGAVGLGLLLLMLMLLLLAGWRVGKDDKVVSGVIGRDAGLSWRLVEDQEKVEA